MNITRKQEKKKKAYTSIKSSKPFEILHMDVTVFRTADGAKNYIYMIRDNFSKAILASKAAAKCCSQIARGVLEEVLIKYDLQDQAGTLITDNGSENKGAVDEWLNKPGMLWKRVIAQLDIIQSNSIAEAGNKLIKYRYLFLKKITDPSHLGKELLSIVDWQQNMPLLDLTGYTPLEVLNGAIPDKHRFKIQIAKAKTERLLINQNIECNNTC